MNSKCVAKCVSLCPKENITDEKRCRVYDIGRSTIIKPYFQWAECPKQAKWEKVESEVTE